MLAIPMIKQGFKPDSISTDLHTGSMNSSTKDILNVASKFMAIGMSLQEVVAGMTAAPARQIQREDLGNLSPGSVADIAVISVQKGRFGYTDMLNTRVDARQRLVAELTIKDGKIVYDLNGLESLAWNVPPGDVKLDSRWTSFPRQDPALGVTAR
jgi:dihydroorotase